MTDGWVQESYDKPEQYNNPAYYKWLEALSTRERVSITSLEIYHATLGCSRSVEAAAQGPHALICYRNPEFVENVPDWMQWLFDFE